MDALLADIILVLHFTYASFVLGGFLVLPLGLAFRWAWVRARSFRLPHLVCTTIVAVEALIGLTCPLTWLENIFLRTSGGVGYDRSFVGHLLYRLLYYDAPAWVFTGAYVAVALGVLTLFFYAPPMRKPRRSLPPSTLDGLRAGRGTPVVLLPGPTPAANGPDLFYPTGSCGNIHRRHSGRGARAV